MNCMGLLIKKNKRLDKDEFIDTQAHFKHCFETAFNKLAPEDQELIVQFTRRIDLRLAAFSMRPDSIAQLTQEVFSQQVISDFLFDLSFRFFSSIGSTNDYTYRLALSLAQGLLVDGYELQQCRIPVRIAESCPHHLLKAPTDEPFLQRLIRYLQNRCGSPETELTRFLVSNKHFMLIYLIQLTVTE